MHLLRAIFSQNRIREDEVSRRVDEAAAKQERASHGLSKAVSDFLEDKNRVAIPARSRKRHIVVRH